MALSEWLSRAGDRFSTNVDAAGPMGLASLGAAIAGAPRNQWGAGLAQGLAGFSDLAQKNKKKASLAEALKGAMGDFTPQQQAFFSALGPDNVETVLPLVAKRLFPEKTEHWTDLGNGRQQNTLTGEIKDTPRSLADEIRLRAAGRSNVTVNNIPAEVGGRIGMGEGFLSRFDEIKGRLSKLGIKGRGQMLFNTGEGGEVKRWMESGKDALVRGLTGAGMAVAEAENYASRYSANPLDTDFDLSSKADQLKYDLENVAKGVFKARGGKYTPPKSGDYSDVDEILGIK